MLGQVTTTIKRNDIRKLSEQGQAAAIRRNFELAQLTADIAKQLCPVSDNNDPDHTHLKDTIRAELDARTGNASAIAGDPDKGVDYALFVELGTVNMSPEPYMMPAVESVKKSTMNRTFTMYKGH